MRRIYILISFFVFFTFINTKVFSQFFLTFGPTAGVSVPIGDYSGETIDFYNGVKYGLKPGVNFGAMGVIRTQYINLKGGLTYSLFWNSGNAEYNRGSVELKQNVLTFCIGPQYGQSIPNSKARIYVDALLLYSIFAGSSKFVDAPYVTDGKYDLNTTGRIGTQFGLGTEVKLETFRLDFNISFGILNLTGKEFTNYQTESRENAYINLNDNEDPFYSPTNALHPIKSSRTISLIKFNISALYDINF